MVNTRRCERCSVVLSPWQRADAVYCGTRCRVAAHRARVAAGSASAIPSALRSRARWVRHDAKRPITVTGHGASVTNPRTWSTYEAASASLAGDGLGFVLNGEGGIICIDIDHCIGDDGGLAPWAAGILDTVPAATYIEVSPHGLHVWGTGELDRGRIVKVDGGRLELYGHGRFMTISGQPFAGAPSDLAPLGDFIAALTM